ncbi:hypothetical protein COU57_03490 [Candidatus Pacearchaeota archaeon CG10_big_fil_rev_8_21_14_0_10_32_14]|nr:MAG: hypothetical protein COU57_03490 [Candidatus Pacearchaeota archaeon CG10_big_fil_rev_8_21_14_0_10_32_14]
MKLTKTVKYHYHLTEKTLLEDIDKFISDARKGAFSWDYKFNSEGLKIIKQYFRILRDKFDNKEYEECKICYHKLILFLFDASLGKDDADFGYEDLLAKITDDFDKIIRNYFLSLVKTCDMDELAQRVSSYAAHMGDYGFESDIEILIGELDKEKLTELKEKILSEAEGMTKKDYDKQDMVYFLLSLAIERKDKTQYLFLCEKFKGILKDDELNDIKKEYDYI